MKRRIDGSMLRTIEDADLERVTGGSGEPAPVIDPGRFELGPDGGWLNPSAMVESLNGLDFSPGGPLNGQPYPALEVDPSFPSGAAGGAGAFGDFTAPAGASFPGEDGGGYPYVESGSDSGTMDGGFGDAAGSFGAE